MNKTKLWMLGILLAVFLVFDWFFAMTYTIYDVRSWMYLGLFAFLGVALYFIDVRRPKKSFKPIAQALLALVVLFVTIGLYSSVIFNARKHAAVIGDINDVVFIELYGGDRSVEMSYVDKDSAVLAAEKRIGELSDVSSRFEINHDEFSQINYNGKMVRVAPFKYADWFKQITSISNGVPYYTIVTTGDGNTNAAAQIVTLDEPMMYYPSAPLNYNLHRLVAQNFKFSYVDDWYFEIDDNGHPYWLIQVVTNDVGLWGAKNMEALIIVDAVSGDLTRYELDALPEWVDTVYPTDMLLRQASNHYRLEGGFINSIFQQRGVMAIDQVSGSYNYVMIDGEIYIFTGVRPVKAESTSTTGLLFISKRTGEAFELDLPGVSLSAAESTSVGSIQEKGYTPITPALQNIGGYPTYVMSLKDGSGVVRGFSFVNYQDYTKSAVGDLLSDTERNYLNVMGSQTEIDPEDVQEHEGIITDIRSVIIDGNTFFMIKLEGDDVIYQAALNLNYDLVFMDAGTAVSFEASGHLITSIARTD